MEAEALTAQSDSGPNPSSLRIEHALSDGHWAMIADINADSWNVPRGWTEPLLTNAIFRSNVKGWLGFLDELPVCAAVTHQVLGYTFVAWVATLAEYRKRGFAGALVRWAISHDDRDRVACVVSGPQAVSAYLAAGFMRHEQFRLYLAPS